MADSQGKRANDHGDDFKRAVHDILVAAGCQPVDLESVRGRDALLVLQAIDRNNMHRGIYRGVFADDVDACESVLGKRFRVDFLVWCREWPRVLGIMAQHQKVSGSADVKVEHDFATVAERVPFNCLFLLDGPAFTPGIFARVEEHRAKSYGRVAGCLTSLGDFRRWATDGLLYPEPPERLPF